ncbi:DUF2306 domain-containing protein [Opitutus sp. GAS368]|uniref:DUF2306 domain-containing protein n=1 Tax=Opitutus sp. GAS368 TaxID=1882749 RepID=UPI00087D4DF9|nr:DUF2306 domain-containing protein [Opitutus sp. GAS368]SDS59064.1 Predicted membrane protein [Opitutus sp. GAS368]
MTSTSKNLATETVKTIGAYIALNVGTLLLLNLIVQYATFDLHVGFLQAKQDYIHIMIWRVAFYIHVFSSIFTLLAGFSQFSPEILKRHKRVHKLIGRIYVWDVLLINFPTALIMAVYANGHIPSKIAFLTLDCLWFWFTLKALIEVKRGNIANHRDNMMRSYALTFSAVTLRTWRLIFASFSNFDPETIYMIDAWMGFVPNLLFVEWLIARRKRSIDGKTRQTPEHKRSQVASRDMSR